MTKFFRYLEKAIDAFAEVVLFFLGMTFIGSIWYVLSWGAYLFSYVMLIPAKMAIYAMNAFVNGG